MLVPAVTVTKRVRQETLQEIKDSSWRDEYSAVVFRGAVS